VGVVTVLPDFKLLLSTGCSSRQTKFFFIMSVPLLFLDTAFSPPKPSLPKEVLSKGFARTYGVDFVVQWILFVCILISF